MWCYLSAYERSAKFFHIFVFNYYKCIVVVLVTILKYFGFQNVKRQDSNMTILLGQRLSLQEGEVKGMTPSSIPSPSIPQILRIDLVKLPCVNLA